jgi:hypothetical protein
MLADLFLIINLIRFKFIIFIHKTTYFWKIISSFEKSLSFSSFFCAVFRDHRTLCFEFCRGKMAAVSVSPDTDTAAAGSGIGIDRYSIAFWY